MNFTKTLLLGTTALLISGCNPDVLDADSNATQQTQISSPTNTTNESTTTQNTQDTTPQESQVEENSKTIRFIELNDLHAHLVPHKDLVRQSDGTSKVELRGGIAKIATKIKTLRAQNENNVLMNIGDTFHGGAEATFSVGNAIIDSVNALNVDIGVVGNWDFAYGPAVTKLRFTDEEPFKLLVSQSIGDTEVKKVNYPVLAANWFKDSLFSSGDYMVAPTSIIKKDGVKIGFIGLTSDIVERMHKGFALGMNFTQGKAEYITIINTLKSQLRDSGCEVVIVMSELGIHKDKALANAVESGVDIFFSAHTHELTNEPLQSNSGALVVESGNDGYLGVMDVSITPNHEKTFSWHLENITSDIEDDANVKQIVARDRAVFTANSVNIVNPLKQSSSVLTESIDTIAGHSEISLNRRGLLENSFNTAFADLLKQETNTQLALTPGFRYDAIIDAENDVVASGEIKISDVYRFFPSSYSLSTAQASGAHLHDIYEQMLDVVVSKDHFKQNGGWVEKLSGVNSRVNINNEFPNRLLEMKLSSNGEALNNSTLYTIVGCNRPGDEEDILCSYPGFENKKEFINPETSSVYNVSEFFIHALKKDIFHPHIHNDVVDESGLSMWPQTESTQPLWE
jgi:S-sulfosulfanyl-L-cysteine sulfohydrolase